MRQESNDFRLHDVSKMVIKEKKGTFGSGALSAPDPRQLDFLFRRKFGNIRHFLYRPRELIPIITNVPQAICVQPSTQIVLEIVMDETSNMVFIIYDFPL